MCLQLAVVWLTLSAVFLPLSEIRQLGCCVLLEVQQYTSDCPPGAWPECRPALACGKLSLTQKPGHILEWSAGVKELPKY